jgi:putative membrane protein (TIGR04086 family)
VAKVYRNSRFNPQPQRNQGLAGPLLRGIIVSLVVSLVCAFGLTIITLVTDILFIDNYLQYIMVGVTMISIFIGSAFAALRAGSHGLLIGVAIGICYVLISVVIGTNLSQESLGILMLLNKLVAGIGAGVLGGLIGVNL